MKNNKEDYKQDGLESIEEEDVTRRNFYLTLFRLYSDIPFHDCLQSFAKIFNDVFVFEKPGSIQKYYNVVCMLDLSWELIQSHCLEKRHF